MDHVAIMRRSWGLLPKIASGKKIIESRWYQSRRTPWDKITAGDTVYFKNSGEPVTLKSSVLKVFQFDNLTPAKVQNILKEYGKDDGIKKEDIEKFYELFKNKRYCILIFLKDSNFIPPFNISKSGFGAMSAWLTVDNISKVMIR